MKKIANIMICDRCGKNVSDDGERRIGGSPFNGWYHMQKINGSTSLAALEEQKEFDFCSDKCVIDHFTVSPPIEHQRDKIFKFRTD